MGSKTSAFMTYLHTLHVYCTVVPTSGTVGRLDNGDGVRTYPQGRIELEQKEKGDGYIECAS